MTGPRLATAHRTQLLVNSQASACREDLDPLPAVKLFTPDASAMLLIERDPETQTGAFGLCNAALGSRELGFVCLIGLRHPRWRLGVPRERDVHFQTDRLLVASADAARKTGRLQA